MRSNRDGGKSKIFLLLNVFELSVVACFCFENIFNAFLSNIRIIFIIFQKISNNGTGFLLIILLLSQITSCMIVLLNSSVLLQLSNLTQVLQSERFTLTNIALYFYYFLHLHYESQEDIFGISHHIFQVFKIPFIKGVVHVLCIFSSPLLLVIQFLQMFLISIHLKLFQRA